MTIQDRTKAMTVMEFPSQENTPALQQLNPKDLHFTAGDSSFTLQPMAVPGAQSPYQTHEHSPQTLQNITNIQTLQNVQNTQNIQNFQSIHVLHDLQNASLTHQDFQNVPHSQNLIQVQVYPQQNQDSNQLSLPQNPISVQVSQSPTQVPIPHDPTHFQFSESSPQVQYSPSSARVQFPESSAQVQPLQNPIQVEISSQQLFRYMLGKAVFIAQPPDSLRKSNFFNFTIALYDTEGYQLEIEQTQFLGFMPEAEGMPKTLNGVQYRILTTHQNGSQALHDIFIRMIDAQTKQAVCFEGPDKNPQMRRVLLSHEMMCTRCCENKSCGNRNQTPSAPEILDKKYLKFYLKCNQNCLIKAGNPRELRRFQVAVMNCEFKALAVSGKMFIHNNSKHGRLSTKRIKIGNSFDCSLVEANASSQEVQAKTSNLSTSPLSSLSSSNSSSSPSLLSSSSSSFSANLTPKVKAIIPNNGWVAGGNRIVIIGENFVPGLQVRFGPNSVYAEFLTPEALSVKTPPFAFPATVHVALVDSSGETTVFSEKTFTYNSLSGKYTIDNALMRLQRLVYRVPGDEEIIPTDIMLHRTADLIEGFYEKRKRKQINRANGKGHANGDYDQNSHPLLKIEYTPEKDSDQEGNAHLQP